MSLLEVKEVKSGYGRMLVLHGVDLSVAEGALTVLLGPNGAGKTTLMQTIFGLLPLAAGSVQFQGESIAGLDPALIARKGIGYVPQENSVFPDLTVHENLEMGGFSLKDSRKTVNEVYELFPRLKERVTQKAGTLSGGERQMLAVGCALLLKPRLLILDEPTTGLAPQMREVLIETIREINNRGTSILAVVEEEPKQFLKYANAAYLLDSGVIKKAGTGEEFLKDEFFDQLLLGR